MPIELPRPIADYFEADRGKNIQAIMHCFAEDAVVHDEGHSHIGREAIGQWKADAAAKYRYTAEPFAIAAEGHHAVVISHLTGDFPGSPIDLRYQFVLAGDKIAKLEIGL